MLTFVQSSVSHVRLYSINKKSLQGSGQVLKKVLEAPVLNILSSSWNILNARATSKIKFGFLMLNANRWVTLFPGRATTTEFKFLERTETRLERKVSRDKLNLGKAANARLSKNGGFSFLFYFYYDAIIKMTFLLSSQTYSYFNILIHGPAISATRCCRHQILSR